MAIIKDTNALVLTGPSSLKMRQAIESSAPSRQIALVQAGITAMRDPKTGAPIPGEPMYVLRHIESINPEADISYDEEDMLMDASGLFKGMMDRWAANAGQYIESCGMQHLVKDWD